MFKINKAAGIANALIGGYEGFNRTMGAYPYPINIALAGLSLAASLAQVQAIRSTTFGGGGSGTTPSAAGSVPTINNTPAQTPLIPPASDGLFNSTSGSQRAIDSSAATENVTINFRVEAVDAQSFNSALERQRGSIVRLVQSVYDERGRRGGPIA